LTPLIQEIGYLDFLCAFPRRTITLNIDVVPFMLDI